MYSVVGWDGTDDLEGSTTLGIRRRSPSLPPTGKVNLIGLETLTPSFGIGSHLGQARIYHIDMKPTLSDVADQSFHMCVAGHAYLNRIPLSFAHCSSRSLSIGSVGLTTFPNFSNE